MTVPDTMWAARLHEYGVPSDVVIETIPVPVAGAGEVLVHVKAASVNFPDLLRMAGRYQANPLVPFTPGSEVSGVVVATGPGVSSWQAGDRVAGTVVIGGFAEYAVAKATMVRRVATAISDVHAAAAGVTYHTAFQALRAVADVRPDEWVVVLGAAGGVGLAAVDCARALGAQVIAAASSDEKLAACAARGASACINYHDDDLRRAILDITGEGADVVIDPVGGRWAEQAVRACRRGSRFVTVGYASGEIPSIPLNLVLLKGVAILGYDGRNFAAQSPAAAAAARAELDGLLAGGELEPFVSQVYPLERVVHALEELASRRAIGKVVVTIGHTPASTAAAGVDPLAT